LTSASDYNNVQYIHVYMQTYVNIWTSLGGTTTTRLCFWPHCSKTVTPQCQRKCQRKFI